MGLRAISINKTDAIFNKPDNYYTVFVQCKGTMQKVYYAQVFRDGSFIRANVKNSKGQRFYGIAKWDGTGEYSEEYGDKLAILRAVIDKERHRRKKFNSSIQNKEKQVEILVKEIKRLEKQRDNNGLKEVMDMYNSFFNKHSEVSSD